MKTKREVLKDFVNGFFCKNFKCENCPYNNFCYSNESKNLGNMLARIGAMAILRQNRKEKRVFDKNKVLTCVTSDKAVVGMSGYFADNLTQLKLEFDANRQSTLIEKQGEHLIETFVADDELGYVLFYPIDKEEE